MTSSFRSPDTGFARIAAAVPPVRVADTDFNRAETLALWQRAHDEGAAAVFFPELGLSAYTAGDLHMDQHLLDRARAALVWLLEQGGALGLAPLAVVGLPLAVHPGVYNVAAVLQRDRLLGIVPKAYLPNYREFYEKRQFREGRHVLPGSTVDWAGKPIPFGTDLLFAATDEAGLVIGVEICEDGWVQLPPHAFQVSAGATVIGNLSGSNFVLGKGETRHQLGWAASGPGMCAYVYTAAGPGESSSDLAFDAHALIYDRGECLAESTRFARGAQLVTADVDLAAIARQRRVTGSFGDCAESNRRAFRTQPFAFHRPASFSPLRRHVEPHPFVPKNPATLATRCWEVFEIQTNALVTRMAHSGARKLVLAISGGRDSTLAALACASALDQMERPRTDLICVSMPGLGTSLTTRQASRDLATALGAAFEEEDVRDECYLVLRDQSHPAAVEYATWLATSGLAHSADAFVGYVVANRESADVEFENVQARIRTLRIMTKANRHWGLAIGTGDMSEKALGWATFNGDSIAMYDVNCGIPKTLVEFVIRWVATDRAQTWAGAGSAGLRRVLEEILAAPITPELLPTGVEGSIAQLTETTIGPFELHDFFLHQFVLHGATPARIAFLAGQAFGSRYDGATIRRWLTVFVRRFFANQWKRDVTADGPKVHEIALSPRGDWRMPSDAVVASWLAEIEALEIE
jgi:NAD+ synthase (glutamine-hydrolysing)